MGRIRLFHGDFFAVTFRCFMQTLIAIIWTGFRLGSSVFTGEAWCAVQGSNLRPLPCQGSCVTYVGDFFRVPFLLTIGGVA